MRLSTPFLTFLLGCATFAAALPAEAGEVTTSAPAAPTASASPPDSLDNFRWEDLKVPETPDPKDPTALGNKESSFNWDVFPIRGNSTVTLFPNGIIAHEYHLRNIDASRTVTYALVCTFRDAKPGQLGHIWYFASSGTLQRVGQAGNHDDFHKTAFNHQLQEFWGNFIASGENVRCILKPNVDVETVIRFVLARMKLLGPVIEPVQRITI